MILISTIKNWYIHILARNPYYLIQVISILEEFLNTIPNFSNKKRKELNRKSFSKSAAIFLYMQIIPRCKKTHKKLSSISYNNPSDKEMSACLFHFYVIFSWEVTPSPENRVPISLPIDSSEISSYIRWFCS